MAKLSSPLLPTTASLLEAFGERLRLARLRRRLQSKQVAERAGMSVITLRKIEKGDPGVTLGAYLNVLQVLQLESDLNKLAEEDALGRRLQDIEGAGGMRIRRHRRDAQTIKDNMDEAVPSPALLRHPPKSDAQRLTDQAEGSVLSVEQLKTDEAADAIARGDATSVQAISTTDLLSLFTIGGSSIKG